MNRSQPQHDGGEMTVVRTRGLRTGYTTGACAAAAARAATLALLTEQHATKTTIHLPDGTPTTFTLHRCDVAITGKARCSVIKDAGDDPDVTHGAEIVATVWWTAEPGISLRGGPGVGTVTLPGLGLAVGGPAINPVPRRMITAEVREAAGVLPDQRGLVVEISVPGGEDLAKRTLNARLGILGGISILGTTGIVKPYSTAAYRASVEQGIDVTAANGQQRVVLSTGGRSERFAQQLLDLPEICFVEMGEFTGHALKRALRQGMEGVHLAGMIGKFSKLARGHFMTHVAGNQVEPRFLAALAADCGADADLQAAIAAANTARHVLEIATARGLDTLPGRIALETARQCHHYAHARLTVEAILFGFEGQVLGRAVVPRGAG